MQVINPKYGAGIVLTLLMAAVVFAQERGPEQGHIGPQPGGPFNDEVFGAVSDDGINFRILDGPFFRHASVPDVLELARNCPAGAKGILLLYFVDFSEAIGPASEGISVAASEDGLNWSEKSKVMIQGKANKGAAVDPSVVQLADGRIRLFFFGSEAGGGDPAMQPGEHKIYSAISDDGLNFQVEPDVCFQAASITDPEVLYAGGQWLMFISRGQDTLLARSQDGLKFTLDAGFRLNIGGVPGAVALLDGNVRIFATGRGGIVSARFSPRSGALPTLESGTRISSPGRAIVADPACVIRSDGSYYLIFKRKP